MKCPKCGFNSFEYYDSCKKCAGDLTGYKQTYSISSIVLPQEAKERLASVSRTAESAADLGSDASEAHDDIFSFDLPDVSPSAPAKGNDNPFDFDEPSNDIKHSTSSKSEDDVFADLLESTPQTAESPFAAADTAVSPAAAKSAGVSAEPGEYDLGNFSWDDTPAESKEASASDNAEAADDFDSLFGDSKKNTSK